LVFKKMKRCLCETIIIGPSSLPQSWLAGDNLGSQHNSATLPR
jgi:hypothetical protein